MVRRDASRTAANASGMSSSMYSPLWSLCFSSFVFARSPASSRASISGSSALTAGGIADSSLSFLPSPAANTFLRMLMCVGPVLLGTECDQVTHYPALPEQSAPGARLLDVEQLL